jgi:hypothetical protein
VVVLAPLLGHALVTLTLPSAITQKASGTDPFDLPKPAVFAYA